jgi:tetratricopeptide (TPR) repeat protein
MVRCIGEFPPSVRDIVTVQEQLALALNRRNNRGDRDRAIRILRDLIQEHGPSPETHGILGRVYKDLYTEKQKAGRIGEASAALEEAIRCYMAGFEADPRDYYPGINAITLSLQQEGEEARRRVQELTPVVSFSVARRNGISSNDYWDVATVYELATIAKDWQTAERAGARLSMLADEAWMLETTINNSALIKQWLDAGQADTEPLDRIVEMLNRRATEIRGDSP